MTVTPMVALDAPAELLLSATPAIRDLAGNALGGPQRSWSWTYPSWLVLGHPLPFTAHSVLVCIASAFDADGRIAVALLDGTDIRVYLWSGSWADLGTVNLQPMGLVDISVVLPRGRGPIVAWPESGVLVKQWDGQPGQSWSFLGGILKHQTVATAASPSLAVDSSGSIIVAWRENAGASNDIHVRKWDAASRSWTSIAPALPIGGVALMSLMSDDPVVVERGALAGTVAILRRGLWSTHSSLLPPAPLRPRAALSVSSVAVGPGGTVYAGFSGAVPTLLSIEPPTDFFVGETNGSGWSLLGSAPLNTPEPGTGVSLGLAVESSGVPVAAYSERVAGSYALRVARRAGAQWVQVGEPVNVDPAERIPFASLGFDEQDVPTVVWSEASNVYAARLNR